MLPDPAIPDESVRHDALLAVIVESSDDAIVAKDLNGVIRSWNRGAERLFGYSAGEAIGKPVSILAPPGVNEMGTILSRIRAGERVDGYETHRRYGTTAARSSALRRSPVTSPNGSSPSGSCRPRRIN